MLLINWFFHVAYTIKINKFTQKNKITFKSGNWIGKIEVSFTYIDVCVYIYILEGKLIEFIYINLYFKMDVNVSAF